MNETIPPKLKEYSDLITSRSSDLLKYQTNTDEYKICHAELMHLVREADKFTNKLFPSQSESKSNYKESQVQDDDD